MVACVYELDSLQGFQGWFLKERLRHAWLAFTGKCDLVRWPEGQ